MVVVYYQIEKCFRFKWECCETGLTLAILGICCTYCTSWKHTRELQSLTLSPAQDNNLEPSSSFKMQFWSSTDNVSYRQPLVYACINNGKWIKTWSLRVESNNLTCGSGIGNGRKHVSCRTTHNWKIENSHIHHEVRNCFVKFKFKFLSFRFATSDFLYRKKSPENDGKAF